MKKKIIYAYAKMKIKPSLDLIKRIGLMVPLSLFIHSINSTPSPKTPVMPVSPAVSPKI